MMIKYCIQSVRRPLETRDKSYTRSRTSVTGVSSAASEYSFERPVNDYRFACNNNNMIILSHII